MAKKAKRDSDGDLAPILTNILITQLAMGGVPNQTIRQIVGGDVNRVSRITKHIKAARRDAERRNN
jgi:hypothetical protein